MTNDQLKKLLVVSRRHFLQAVVQVVCSIQESQGIYAGQCSIKIVKVLYPLVSK